MKLQCHFLLVALLLAGCQSSAARHELRLRDPIIITARDQTRRAHDSRRLYPILVGLVHPWTMTVADDGSFVVTVTTPEGPVAWGHLEYIPRMRYGAPIEPFDWNQSSGAVCLVITHASDADAAFWREQREAHEQEAGR